ncbi:CoA-binding domain protein [Sulfobacillus acidophilus TPY]|uniref:CoA-binding domain protein n=1 Tax=Sulfobacillus acidophilus (strain ATCC 700253 / DSM 10332 / NAL) TaxID=679936 RepID=G8TVM8_SULAD|nr:CoA-binding domain protein [Sulfobacillus acidophilus TPY]AEW03667.1 CoA-binding domain protein [Sulfobacillus acidophilus DSM 10332]
MARVILRDGRVAELRPPNPTPEDRERLHDLFRRCSKDSLYFRFFHVVADVGEDELTRMMTIIPGHSYALVCDAGEAFLAIGNYVQSGPGIAEVAFLVDDQLHGRGLGTLLLEHMAHHAWLEGFRQFEAYVLSDNYQMLRVFRSSGFQLEQKWEDGALHLVLPLNITERQRALQALREKLATAASLHPFFHPRTVAVIGASRDPERLGHVLLQHIIAGNFQGTVYPVNPQASAVAAVHAYPRIQDVPEPVDLAVIVVPVRELEPVVNECIAAHVRAVVITTSGLSDAGEDGAQLEKTLTARLRQAGIRLMGPNCLGLLTTHPNVRLNASFAPKLPRPGRLALASHSGALGIAILDYADRMGLGISRFASLGNKPDVSGNDLLQYWEDDPDTDVIMLYLESFGNPRKFSQITRRISRTKPILVVKSARTRRTRPDVTTRSMRWDMLDAPVDALFRQSGIIRADTLEELFDVAAILTSQPLPRGRRVALVTNSAAGATIAEDALITEGLQLACPAIDLGFDALADRYARAIPDILARDDVDALMVLYVPVGLSETEAVLSAIREAVARSRQSGAPLTPVVANVLMNDPVQQRFLPAGETRIPVYPFPELAVRALARVARYAEYVRQPAGRIPDLPHLDTERARTLVTDWMHQGLPSLQGDAVTPLLEAIGIPARIEAYPANDAGWSLAVVTDKVFGPILGLQGTTPRIRLVPLTDQDASNLVSHCPDPLKPLLYELVLRVSRLVDEVPEIQSIELAHGHLKNHTLTIGQAEITLSRAT